MTDKKPRKRIDWDAVEPVYRAGIKTLRQLGEEFDCAESAIRKKAKEAGWTRDLSGKIKQRANELVRKSECAESAQDEKSATEKQQVEIGAKVQSDIILAHRKIIGKTRKITADLLKELDKNDDDLTLAVRTGIVAKLTQTIGTLTTTERTAFGIDSLYDPDKSASGDGSKVDVVDLARRMVYIMNKAVKEQDSGTN